MLNKELLKIYEDNLENQPNMSPDVLAKYGKLQDAIEEYIEAVSKNVSKFRMSGRKSCGRSWKDLSHM